MFSESGLSFSASYLGSVNFLYSTSLSFFVLNDLVFNTIIPRNVKLSEAPSFSLPGVLYDQKCLGSIAYQKLTAEFFIREKRYFSKGA